MNKRETYLIKKRLHTAFRRLLQFESGGNPIKDFLGCDVFTVRNWIEKLWGPNMTWDNYGSFWVVDHIVPIRMFDLSNIDEIKICWHYKNLMPLLKADNLKKEGNIFFSFLLLNNIKHKDFFYEKLYQKILPELDSMTIYIEKYNN